MGSEARMTRELLRDPRILRILVMCSEVMDEFTLDLRRLFFRSVMVSIMNLVRTDREASPALATAGWMRRTMSLRDEGSSCRSWGPESGVVSRDLGCIRGLGRTSDDFEE